MQAFAPTMLLNSVGMASGTGRGTAATGSPAQGMGFENMLQGLLTGDATPAGGVPRQGFAGAAAENMSQLTPSGTVQSLQALLDALAQALTGTGQNVPGHIAGQSTDRQMIGLSAGNAGTELQQLSEYLHNAVSPEQASASGLDAPAPEKLLKQVQDVIDTLLQQINASGELVLENASELKLLETLLDNLLHVCAPDAVGIAPGAEVAGAQGDTALVPVGALQDALQGLRALLYTHGLAGQDSGPVTAGAAQGGQDSGSAIPGAVLPDIQQQTTLPEDQSSVPTIGQQVMSAAGNTPAVKATTGLFEQNSSLQQAVTEGATLSSDASKTGSLLLDQMLNRDMGTGSDTRDTGGFSLQRFFQPVVRLSAQAQAVDTFEALSSTGQDTHALQAGRGTAQSLLVPSAGEGLESVLSSQVSQDPVRPVVLSATVAAPEQPGLNAQYLIDQISARIAAGTKTTENRITLQLHPPTLGKVYIDLSLHDHQLRAVVFAENQHVKHVLEGSLEQLRAALEQHNIEVDKLTVDVGSQGNQFASLLRERAGQSRQRHSGSMAGQSEPMGGEAAETVRTPAVHSSGSAGALDLFA